VLGPYRDILSRPGALAFSLSGAVARLPMSVLGIGIVLLISDVYGSYALAGRVAAAYVIAQAVFAPQLSRWVDRHGQARTMRPALALAGVGLSALVVAGTMGAPTWTLYASAAVTGATLGSMGALVRARWSHVLSDERSLETAFALESALDEVVFAFGPLAATFLATAVAPAAALVLPLVAGVGGGFWFLAQKQTEPPPTGGRGAGRTRSVVRTRGMLPLVLIFVALGGVFGATELSTVAFAEEHGNKAYAGPVLAAFAIGSLTAGVIYGARHWISPLWQRFLVGIVALSAGTALFQVVHSVPELALVMLIAGLAIAPTLIAGNGLVQLLVEPGRLTEGLTWVGTTLGVGVSLSASLAGAAIDRDGSHGGFLVVTASALTAVVLGVVSVPWLRTRRAASLRRTGRADLAPSTD
jgi:MFS family permease